VGVQCHCGLFSCIGYAAFLLLPAGASHCILFLNVLSFHWTPSSWAGAGSPLSGYPGQAKAVEGAQVLKTVTRDSEIADPGGLAGQRSAIGPGAIALCASCNCGALPGVTSCFRHATWQEGESEKKFQSIGRLANKKALRLRPDTWKEGDRARKKVGTERCTDGAVTPLKEWGRQATQVLDQGPWLGAGTETAARGIDRASVFSGMLKRQA